MEERLQKIIAARGICSRRAAEKLITEGRVSLNGQVVSDLGTKADPDIDEISVDGNILPKEESHHVYYLLYKPAGYITSAHDERGRRTVLDLLPKDVRLYPVGRLDYNTSGLLLLTNDGDLTNGLLHPRGEIPKTYNCAVIGLCGGQEINKLCRGVKLEDGITAPAKAKVLKRQGAETVVEITIHEGRNRQVRRMMQAVGLEVKWLKRVGFAGLDLKGLKTGEYRQLLPREVAMLKRLSGIE